MENAIADKHKEHGEETQRWQRWMQWTGHHGIGESKVTPNRE